MLTVMALTLGSAAVFEDVRRNLIPNWIPIAAVSGGFVYHGSVLGWAGLGVAALGTIVGFGLLLGFYCVGAMGAGDVKLMAGVGAMLGPSGVLLAGLLAAPAGALIAGAISIWKPRRRAVPYAPAIVLGTWLALLGKG